MARPSRSVAMESLGWVVGAAERATMLVVMFAGLKSWNAEILMSADSVPAAVRDAYRTLCYALTGSPSEEDT